MKVTMCMLSVALITVVLAACCLAQDGVGLGVTRPSGGDRGPAQPSTLRLRGIIRPYRHVVLRAPFDAQVVRVLVETGQQVTGKTVVVRLDSRPLQRELEVAQASLVKIGSELKSCEIGLEQIDSATDRLREDRGRAGQRLDLVRRSELRPGAIGRIVTGGLAVMRAPVRESVAEGLEEAIAKAAAGQLRIRASRGRLLSLRQNLQRAEHEARAAVRMLQQRVAQAIVTAQISGVVARCLVQSSTSVGAGDVLLEVIQTDRMKATIWLPEHYGGDRFDHGNDSWTARVRLSDAESPWFTAIVGRVAPLPHPQADQAMLEVEVDNTKGVFQAGMRIDAIVEMGTRKGL